MCHGAGPAPQAPEARHHEKSGVKSQGPPLHKIIGPVEGPAHKISRPSRGSSREISMSSRGPPRQSQSTQYMAQHTDSVFAVEGPVHTSSVPNTMPEDKVSIPVGAGML